MCDGVTVAIAVGLAVASPVRFAVRFASSSCGFGFGCRVRDGANVSLAALGVRHSAGAAHCQH